MEYYEKAIINLFGEKTDKDKYYVYALCDPKTHVPFYIGKGEGGRVWAHEEGEKKEEDSIVNDTEISDEEKEELLASLTEKHKAIRHIKENSNEPPEKVIIKWGLTSHEAFMAESALINLLQFLAKGEYLPDYKTLTNIANGHASDKEKAFSNIAPVEARPVQDFMHLMKQIDISEEINYIVLVRINKLYKPGMSSEELKEIVSGLWRCGDRIQDAIKDGKTVYALGMYGRVVKSVYRIVSTVSVPELAKMYEKRTDAPDDPETEIYDPQEWDRYGLRAEDRRRLRHIIDSRITLGSNDELNDPQKMKAWKERKLLLLEDTDMEMKNKYQNAYLVCRKNEGFLKNAQNPISFNFESITKKKTTTVKLKEWE